MSNLKGFASMLRACQEAGIKEFYWPYDEPNMNHMTAYKAKISLRVMLILDPKTLKTEKIVRVKILKHLDKINRKPYTRTKRSVGSDIQHRFEKFLKKNEEFFDMIEQGIKPKDISLKLGITKQAVSQRIIKKEWFIEVLKGQKK